MNKCICIETAKAWSNGLYEGIQLNHGISLAYETTKSGVYIGEIIDSGERKHIWSKLSYMREKVAETSVVLNVLALESLWLDITGQFEDLEKSMSGGQWSAKALVNRLEALGPQKYDNADHVLLIDLQGRYLVYWFEVIAEGPSDIISKIAIEYERFSWLSYLPQIYADRSDFLERYLAVFQTIHDDIEAVVDNMAEIYMPERTEASFLDVIESWLPVDGYDYWNEAQKRELLSQYQTYASVRGSKAGVEKYVSLFTQTQPYVVEPLSYKYLLDSEYHTKVYQRLYTDNAYSFTLLLERDCVKQPKKYQALNAIIKQIIPAQVSYKVALLNPYMVLDDYVYLGINSYICNQSEIVLDEQSMLSMGVIGGESGEGMASE